MLATREADTPSRVEGRLSIDESMTGGQALVASKRNAQIVLIAFLSKYSREISLAEALQLDVIAAYRKRETGQKYLINPNKAAS